MAEPTPTPTVAYKKPPPPKLGLWRGWIRPLLTVILVVTALRSSLVDWNDVPTGSMIPTVAVGDRIVVNKLAYGFNLPFNGPVVSIPLTGISFSNPLDFLPGFYYGAPQVNDIVTFWKPGGFNPRAFDRLVGSGVPEEKAREAATTTDGGIRMVKRIVAGPGDVVQMVRTREKFDGRFFDLSKLIINGNEATYTKEGPHELIERIDGHRRRVHYVSQRSRGAAASSGVPRPAHARLRPGNAGRR